MHPHTRTREQNPRGRAHPRRKILREQERERSERETRGAQIISGKSSVSAPLYRVFIYLAGRCFSLLSLTRSHTPPPLRSFFCVHARVYTCVYRHEKRVEEEEDDDEERSYINGRRSLARECIVKLSLRTAERGREKEKFQLIKLYEQIKYCARQCSGASTFLLFHSFSLSLSLSLLLIGHSTPRAQKLARCRGVCKYCKGFYGGARRIFLEKRISKQPRRCARKDSSNESAGLTEK